MEKKKRKLAKSEICWIVISGVIGLGGLALIVLGFVADYLPVLASENYTGQAAFESVMHLSYRWLGAILLVLAAFISVIFLNYYAKKSDLDAERTQRRAERLRVISDSADAKNGSAEAASSGQAADSAKPS
jgi:membrane-bound ClpP family serine protease